MNILGAVLIPDPTGVLGDESIDEDCDENGDADDDDEDDNDEGEDDEDVVDVVVDDEMNEHDRCCCCCWDNFVCFVRSWNIKNVQNAF